MEKSSKAFEEMGDLTKGNLEAIVESSKIAAKGVESLSQGAADFGRKSFEKTSATMKSFASVKTPAEFFQLQSELMSSMLDSFASESAKSSEAMLKLASEISQPLSNRVSVVTEKMKSIAA
jgi:phasin family protein